MIRMIMFLMAFTFAEQSFASACMNYYKNCQGLSAKKMYLYTTPVCVMNAVCDSYCGQVKFGRSNRTLYCKFQDNNPNRCLREDDCAEDNSVVQSKEDIRQLTDNPRSPGYGARPDLVNPGAAGRGVRQ